METFHTNFFILCSDLSRGARHGLILSGKLARIERQEQEALVTALPDSAPSSRKQHVRNRAAEMLRTKKLKHLIS
jgi:hypothetical protein